MKKKTIFLIPLILASCNSLSSTNKEVYFSRTYSLYKEKIQYKSEISNYSICDLPIENTNNSFNFKRDDKFNVGDYPIDNYLKIGNVPNIKSDIDREKYKDFSYFNFHFKNNSNYSAKIEAHLAYQDGSFEDFLYSYYIVNNEIRFIYDNGEQRIGKYGYFIEANNRISLLPIDVKIENEYKTLMLWVKNGIFGAPIDD